jgi:hypothetical protein
MRRAAIGLLCAALGACAQDPYGLVSLDDGGRHDTRALDGEPCVKTGVELCDGKDNDCDGQIDEDFNLDLDPRNCGKCGLSCQLPGAITACELRACKFLGCAPGYYDLNATAGDGCEYACTLTGPEVCDGKDNDCNGKADETFDLTKDPDNCGACGVVCQLANALAKCEGSQCKVVSCKPGYIDLDKKDANGCESPCTLSNGGVELCDGKDNDCNGVVDDPGGKPIDHQTDPMHCGGCNVQCLAPNASATCLKGKCAFSACTKPYMDADGNPDNGCECLPSGQEACDGKDNDCNGKVDDGIAQGSCGKSVGECKAGILSCVNGVEVCTGKVDAQPEFCDGKDNDCNGEADPPACVFAKSGRERRLDQPGLATLGAQNSAQLAVAGSGELLTAVWLDRRNDRGDLYGNRSTNGGASWLTADLAIATEAEDKLEPRVAIGGPTASGAPRVYVAYEAFVGNGREVRLRRSLDGGQSWGAHVPAKRTAGGDALFVRLAVLPATSTSGQDKVVVCWEQIAVSGALDPNVYCNLSTNSGQSFLAADVRANGIVNNAFVPELAVDSGYLHVVWQQGAEIRAARASLAGTTLVFGGEAKLSNGAGQLPRIVADGSGRVVAIWEDLRDPLINLRANRSLNSGGSWLADGVRVDNDVVNGDSTQPVLAARQGGRIFAAWADTSRGKTDIYLNWSDDGGTSWGSAARRVEAGGVGTATSGRPAIALAPTGSNVYVAWEDGRNGAYRDIYASVSLDGGVTWNQPDYRVNESIPPGVADARAPFCHAGPSRVAVLWMDNRVLAGAAMATGPNADIYSSYLE